MSNPRPHVSFTVAMLVAASILIGPIAMLLAQNNSHAGNVALVKVANAVYPPLARQTHITGDVELRLEIRNDGSVQNAEVVKGHPLLQQIALESARKSLFECRECGDGVVPYQLVYTFELIGPAECCKETDTGTKQHSLPVPRETQSENHVTIVDQPLCTCDPAADVVKVRSLKCLYLWKCAVRYQ